MKNNSLQIVKNALILGIAQLLNSNLQASTPLWTFSAPVPADVIVSDSGTTTVQYTVTNQSSKTKHLIMKPQPGLSASSCYLAAKGSTCTLIITVNGSQIPQKGIDTGPILCEQANPSQCYQPGVQNQLRITRSSADNIGHLQLSLNGNPVTTLSFQPGDSGSLMLNNTGLAPLSGLTINLPFGWQSYFTDNCPSQLQAQQSCTITYAIPTPSASGINNLLSIDAINSDNSLMIPVNIQVIGTLKCWGLNYSGQLGSITNSGTTNANNVPLAVQNLTANIIASAGGNSHTCALLANGAVECWGSNEFGQLGSTTNSGSNNPNNNPLAVQTLNSGVIAITAGGSHTCALLANSAVQCWGSNEFGQLGSTTNSGTTTPNNSPLPVQTLSSGVIAITAGFDYTCALLNSGAVECWGNNQFGQLGSTVNSGTTTPNNSPLPVQTLSSGVIAIASGDGHTCALLDSGAVKCWGVNPFGQLGSSINSGTSNPNSIPLDVQTLSSGVTAISAGGAHTCALINDGTVKCWGLNHKGQLGSTINSGLFVANNSPLPVQTLSSGVIAISAGGAHTCALINDGAVKCWGLNQFGQLGSATNSGTSAPNNSPLAVQTLTNGSTAALFNHNMGSASCAIVN